MVARDRDRHCVVAIVSGPVCEICGEAIGNPNHAWKQTMGWVSPRGSKAMTASHPTGALAHYQCITLLKAGINPRQERFA